MTMTAYLIDATVRQITTFSYEKFEKFRTFLPGGICVGMKYPTGDVLYVDDEALLRKATVAFRIRSRPDGQPMMSNGILTGRDDMNTTLAPDMTREQIQGDIEWLDIPEALQWFRNKANSPALTSRHRGEATVQHASWADFLLNLEGGKGYNPRDSATLHRELFTRYLPRLH